MVKDTGDREVMIRMHEDAQTFECPILGISISNETPGSPTLGRTAGLGVICVRSHGCVITEKLSLKHHLSSAIRCSTVSGQVSSRNSAGQGETST